MFVSKRRYAELEEDYKELAARHRFLRDLESQEITFWKNVLDESGEKLQALHDYVSERRTQKHLSRVAVQNILVTGKHRPHTRIVDQGYDRFGFSVVGQLKPAAGGDQLSLWD